MERVPDRFFLLVACIAVAIGLVFTLNNGTIAIVGRVVICLILMGLIAACITLFRGPAYTYSKENTPEELASEIARNPIRWVKDGLIPPMTPLAIPDGASAEAAAAFETLNRRSANRNLQVTILNGLILNQMLWSRGRNPYENELDGFIQVDYGVGEKSMMYFAKFIFEVPILKISIAWKDDSPLFSFDGLLAKKAAKIWKMYSELKP